MLSEADIEAAASRLDGAERSRNQIGLLSLTYPEIDMEGAYAIQTAWMRKKMAAGRRIVGWKIGLTSKAMQSALKIDIPDSGVLLDDMIFQDGAIISPDRFIQPRIEAEIAFIVGSELSGEDATVYDVLNATEYVTPALEILDTRIVRADSESGKMRTVYDTISDNAANAGIVLGGRPMRPLDVDLRWVGAIVSRNAEIEETGLGAGVLNHPAQSVAWLIRRLAGFGLAISPGDIVLSGSFIRPVEARHGDTIVADYGAYGTVSCHFT
jgi:2-oxo-hept-3-ene-1,7-dioate hydratase